MTEKDLIDEFEKEGGYYEANCCSEFTNWLIKKLIQERSNSVRTSVGSCSFTSENDAGIEPDRVFQAQGTKSGKA